MPYLTTTSIITLEETHLKIKKVKIDPSAHYWLHSLILLSIFIYFLTQRAINTDLLSWGVALFLFLITNTHETLPYLLLLPLITAIALLANNTNKPAPISPRKAWEATPEGQAFKKWEASPAGQKGFSIS